MIIGNNQNFRNDHFQERLKVIQDEAKKRNNKTNSFLKNEILKQSNVTSRTEMADKSLAMLQERLQNGLISLEEFNQKARKINQFKHNK